MRLRRRAALLAAIVAGALVSTAVAWAGFSNTVTASATLATATLLPATAVAAAQVNCQKNVAPSVALTWTASASTFETGYTIYRSTTSGSGYTQIGTVNASTLTITDPSTTLGKQCH